MLPARDSENLEKQTTFTEVFIPENVQNSHLSFLYWSNVGKACGDWENESAPHPISNNWKSPVCPEQLKWMFISPDTSQYSQSSHPFTKQLTIGRALHTPHVAEICCFSSILIYILKARLTPFFKFLNEGVYYIS